MNLATSVSTILAIHEQIDLQRPYNAADERHGFEAELAVDIGAKIDESGEQFTFTREQLAKLFCRAEGAGRYTYARCAGHTAEQAVEILKNADGEAHVITTVPPTTESLA